MYNKEVDIRVKDIKTLKYPLRWVFQILLISVITIFAINFINGIIRWNDPNNSYALYFVLICFIELVSIIYLLRNKTYYAIDKENEKYIINRARLNSKEFDEDTQRYVRDHYLYGNRAIDFLDAIDILFSLPSNKEIQKAIKEKVLIYPKYQIKTISKIFTFLGMKYYRLDLKNGNKKYLLVFNNL
jgi:hypothetical protein